MKIIKEKKNESCSTEFLASNLISLLHLHQINGSELARNLNIPYNTVHRLLNGVTSDPRLSTLQQIAEYFGVTLDVLLNNPVNRTQNFEMHLTIPILEWEYIKKPDFLTSLDRKKWMKWLPITCLGCEQKNKNLFALGSTKSMQPRFPSGTNFIIDTYENPLDGDLVLVRFKNDNSISLRELIIDSPNCHLNAVIAGSSSLIFNSDIHEIFGVIILTLIDTRAEV
ncbi:helix-turn-helix domain-containing protein [Legionella spiritensis]|uniref:helix-turn-helix domain-containing protein n=1 Tax=Legionella spiritensis TaxID=452 RepID=UPI000F6B8F11|nr:helix-turn-helix domain-containing protein [Legionella spiritensis]VEG92251.1 peptidase, S24 family [Legionella spiritensis]